MKYFKIDANKLDALIIKLTKERDFAFARFGGAYVYMGEDISLTQDRLKEACRYAACVRELKDIRDNISLFNNPIDGEKKFNAVQRAAIRDISQLHLVETSGREVFLAEGRQMAFQTVKDNCLVQDVELVSSLNQDTLNDVLASAVAKGSGSNKQNKNLEREIEF